MASVTLDRVWLGLWHDGARGAAQLPLLFVGSRSYSRSKPGRIATYANGRRRAITRAGTFRVVELTVSTDAAGLRTIETWQGKTVTYRDGLGTRWWGVYFDVESEPSSDGRRRDVSLTLESVSFTEAV